MAGKAVHYRYITEGRLGGVARGIGGTLASPPLDVRDVKQYCGKKRGLPVWQTC